MTLDSPWCVLISGSIAAGKTTVAAQLAASTGAAHVRVRQALIDVLGLRTTDRRTLQVEGAALDRRTNGRWLLEYFQRRGEEGTNFVVDAMRTRAQTTVLLEGLTNSRLVYLDVSPQTQQDRFREAATNDPIKQTMDLASALRHATEQEVTNLRQLADLVVETDHLTAFETVGSIISALLV